MTFKNLEEQLVPKSYFRFQQGNLWAWGNNGLGQLGDNTPANKSSPVQTIAGGANWRLVASGAYHTTAIKADGTLWTWGNNGLGQLGDNTSANKSSPVQTITAGSNWGNVAGGGYHTAAIKTDGTLWMWGQNNLGQLGTSNTTLRSSPVQTVAGGTNWKSVSCGNAHTAAIKTDGTLWLWGYNGYGALGDNTSVDKSSPVQTIAGGTSWNQVTCTQYGTAAVKTDGTLWTWGDGNKGLLGDNGTIHKSSPVQTVAGGTNWKLVAGGFYHIAAIKTDGTMWTWGSNGNGQLGDNTIVNKSSPVQTVAGGTNWKSVSCGYLHTAAIKTDGTLWLWGENLFGRLGNNNETSTSSPVQTVAGGTSWKHVSVGSLHTTAITA